MGNPTTRSDLKLALFSVLLTMGDESDLSRLLNLSLILVSKRNKERAQRSYAYMTRDDS